MKCNAMKLVAALFLCSCAAVRPSLSVTSEALKPPPSRLSAEDVARDLAVLRYGLRTAWGGNACGFSAQRVRAERALAAAKRSRTPQQLCDRIAAVIATLPDAHLEASLENECGAQSSQSTIGENFGGGEIWKVDDRADVGLLSIGRFVALGDPRWAGFTEAVEKLKRHPRIIVDLRGNGGGDDRMAYRLAQQLAGHFVARDNVRKIVTRTPESYDVRINTLAIRRAESPEGASQLVQQEAELRDEQRAAALSGGAVMTMPVTHLSPAVDVPPYIGQTVVIVDRGCGSSCENAVDLLKRLPNVHVYGDNTAGAIHFGNAGRIVLPRSRVQVQLGTQCTLYDDGSFFEKRGFAPDVRVPQGTDALAFVLEATAASR